MSGLSFKFSKTSEKKVLSDSKLRDSSTKENDDERDFIKDVKDKAIIGSIKPKENKPLVIPMLKAKNYDFRTTNSKSDAKNEVNKSEDGEQKGESLMSEAARALLAEASKHNQEWNDRSEDGKPKLADIPAIIANALPSETSEENLDVSQRAEASTMDDYESVPIEQFGMAMLRGMGWKEGDGIGGFKNEVVPIFDPQVRPKGLGLGATKPNTKQAAVKEGEEKLVLKKGAHVKIESGARRGLYGEVEGLDEENGRVIVKLTVSKETTSVSENAVLLVTKKEFSERGKVVNIDKYEKYKEKEKVKSERRSRTPEKRKQHKDKRSSHKKEQEVYSVSDDSSRSSSPEIKRRKKTRTWVQTGLRVRCVDSKWREGKFYNVKMEVIDVVTNDSCDCRTDQGKLVQDVRYCDLISLGINPVPDIRPKLDCSRTFILKLHCSMLLFY